MKIIGIGIDAVEIDRFNGAVEQWGEGFLSKIFTDEEQEHFRSRRLTVAHLAGKFAAKEAVKKALPDGAEIGLRWTDIEILNGPDGKPYVRLHGQAKRIMERSKLSRVLVSISHTRSIATSNAVVMENGS